MAEYDLKSRIGKLQELEARGVIKSHHQTELDNYRQQGIVPGSSGSGRAKTTNSDMAELNASNTRAASERDATRQYLQAADAIRDMGGTGPWQETLMASGAPGQSESGQDRGWLANTLSTLGGAVGSTVGALARPVISTDALEGRDRLRTIAAQGALSRASQLKGAASDKDIALVRVAGLDPGKMTKENNRVIKDAIYQSGMEQARALILNGWIADNGSLVARNRRGETYQQVLQRGEAAYAQSYANRQAARRKLPTPPPGVRSANRMVTIDLDGNVIR